jgi:hypothetical protein
MPKRRYPTDNSAMQDYPAHRALVRLQTADIVATTREAISRSWQVLAQSERTMARRQELVPAPTEDGRSDH